MRVCVCVCACVRVCVCVCVCVCVHVLAVNIHIPSSTGLSQCTLIIIILLFHLCVPTNPTRPHSPICIHRCFRFWCPGQTVQSSTSSGDTVNSTHSTLVHTIGGMITPLLVHILVTRTRVSLCLYIVHQMYKHNTNETL